MLAPETKTPTRTQKRLKCNSTNTLRPVEGGSAAGSHHDMRPAPGHANEVAALPPRLPNYCPAEAKRGKKVVGKGEGRPGARASSWRGGWPSLKICCAPSRRPWGLSLSRTGFDIDRQDIATRLTSKSEDLKLRRTHSTRQCQHLTAELPTST